jgi:nucleoside-diphosphate-sugar epimerase
MRVFVTGASGWIGSAVVDQLLRNGHEVLGLARSDASAAAVEAAGARAVRGSIDDPQGLARIAADADAVVHTAYNHDFTKFIEAAHTDRAVIAAIGDALANSDRPFVVTTGIGVLTPGHLITEKDRIVDNDEHPRAQNEARALALAERGVRVSIVRPAPSTHGDGDKGLVAWLIAIAREKGVSAYVGDGSNRWCAVHRFDIAPIYRLAVEKASAGSVFHGVGEEGVPTRAIAEVIGRRLGVPVVSQSKEEAEEHFGAFLGHFWALDIVASNAITREQLGWMPTHRGLLEDLEQGTYFG